jgi:hypothetical protein
MVIFGVNLVMRWRLGGGNGEEKNGRDGFIIG